MLHIFYLHVAIQIHEETTVTLVNKKSFWLLRYIQGTQCEKSHFLDFRGITLESSYSAGITSKKFWEAGKRKSYAAEWVESCIYIILKLQQEVSLSTATQPNKPEREPIPKQAHKELVSCLCGTMQTITRKILMEESLVPWDRWVYKRCAEGNLVNLVDKNLPLQQNIHLVHCHHVFLWFLSPKRSQHPHWPGYHHLLLRHLLPMWSLPAQHLLTWDQPASAHLLRTLPPSLLCAWLLCAILMAAQQLPPSSQPEQDLAHHLRPD